MAKVSIHFKEKPPHAIGGVLFQAFNPDRSLPRESNKLLLTFISYDIPHDYESRVKEIDSAGKYVDEIVITDD